MSKKTALNLIAIAMSLSGKSLDDIIDDAVKEDEKKPKEAKK